MNLSLYELFRNTVSNFIYLFIYYRLLKTISSSVALLSGPSVRSKFLCGLGYDKLSGDPGSSSGVHGASSIFRSSAPVQGF